MSAFYQQLDRKHQADGSTITYYRPLINAQGAWNAHEQHMAAATGLLCAELEAYQARDDMRIARISLDIFGLIAFDEFSITTRIIRAGRTIELLESTFQAANKICIVARAWRLIIHDTRSVSALEDKAIKLPEECLAWQGMKRWSGGYINSIETRIAPEHRKGNGIVWITHPCHIIENQENSDFSHLMSMVDVANGIAPRQDDPIAYAFPNLDLQIHLHRLPQGKWLGIEAVQQFGSDGVGLSSGILHDTQGCFGRSEQILSLRKIN